ncbi:MAG TPA: universal stress protein [Planctomycetota bacterium]|nr:universal stress protein [Planctomycetota bacterium]
MLQKILVPLDGSKMAERALPWARAYAASTKAAVVLIEAVPKVYPLKGPAFGAQQKETSQYLESVARALLAEGIPSEIHLSELAPAEAIVSAAVQESCGLIVMTTRGASKLVRRVIGGVTEQVLRCSRVPVLVIGGDSSVSMGLPPRQILVPQDGSLRSQRVLPWALRLARFHGVPISIVHVERRAKARSQGTSSSEAQVSRRLAHWCSLFRHRGVAATYLLCHGDPVSEILRNTQPTDLLVLTTHGYGGLKHLVLGSVAEKVIHGTEAPVFVVRRASARASGDVTSSPGNGAPRAAKGTRRSGRRS